MTRPEQAWQEPEEDDTPEPKPTCEWCGKECEYDELKEVDNSDRSVGYYSIDWMCYDCIHERRYRS